MAFSGLVCLAMSARILACIHTDQTLAEYRTHPGSELTLCAKVFGEDLKEEISIN